MKGITYPHTSASTVKIAVFRQAAPNAGSSITRSKLRVPTHFVPAKLVFWKLSRTSRTIGYQEKNAKHTSAAHRNPYAERLRCASRRRREADRPRLPEIKMSMVLHPILSAASAQCS